MMNPVYSSYIFICKSHVCQNKDITIDTVDIIGWLVSTDLGTTQFLSLKSTMEGVVQEPENQKVCCETVSPRNGLEVIPPFLNNILPKHGMNKDDTNKNANTKGRNLSWDSSLDNKLQRGWDHSLWR